VNVADAASLPIATGLAWCLFATAIVFAYFRIDDLLFDLLFWYAWFKRWNIRRQYKPFTAADLYKKPQQRIAIFVPCWHEWEVVDKMVDFAVRNIDYDRYDILVGVYPNDQATIERVRGASRRFARVHAIVNDTPGPTTKAQNLNSIYREMKRIEGDDPFEIVVLHDVEDVIHPLSLRLYNHLLPQKPMVQIPVFPLERGWTKFVAWTYADEFCRNHLKDMILRESLQSFVPSAGVGTAFARSALAAVAESDTDLFPEGALTEDYQMALRLHERGLRTIFVNKRLSPEGLGKAATAAAYVATREYFPDRFDTAVRQKARWVAGICLQSWSEIGWRGNAATRYTLYRDRKGIAANVAALFGWIFLTLAGAMYLWHFFDSAVAVPQMGNDPFTRVVLMFVLLGTLFELVQTACFVAWVYGPLLGVLSIVRAPLAAIINGVASLRAIQLFVRARLRKQNMEWAKTQHSFPTDSALSEFRRQLGSLLVERGHLTEGALERGLETQREDGGRLGDILVRQGSIDEHELAGALAAQGGYDLIDASLVRLDAALAPPDAGERLRRLRAVPIERVNRRVLVAVDRALNDEELSELCDALGAEVVVRVAPRSAIDRALFPDGARDAQQVES
jgi:bacteriophage N4 adsorption protein B